MGYMSNTYLTINICVKNTIDFSQKNGKNTSYLRKRIKMKLWEMKPQFYIYILHIYCNASSTFELIKCKTNTFIELVGNFNSCKGTRIDNIYGVECFAICYEPTPPIWEERGYLGLNPFSECDWLVYEEGSTRSDGLCTLCFSDSTVPATTGLGNTLTSLVYAKPSATCKYVNYRKFPNFQN